MEKEFIKHSEESHNPYFNRWFSAMIPTKTDKIQKNFVTILILIDGFLQLRCLQKYVYSPQKSQSLF